MKLNEIKRPTGSEARTYLEANGWKELGKGMFATVYNNPKYDYVVKIFKTTDKGYLAFLNLVKNHSSNPHFPKIKSSKPYLLKDCYAVRLELLKDFEPFGHLSGALSEVQWYMRFLIDEDYGLKPKLHPRTDKFINAPENKQLKEACDLVFPLVKKYGFDMARGNVLARGDQLVIIDPVGSAST